MRTIFYKKKLKFQFLHYYVYERNLNFEPLDDRGPPKIFERNFQKWKILL